MATDEQRGPAARRPTTHYEHHDEWVAHYSERTRESTIQAQGTGDSIPAALRDLADAIEREVGENAD